MSKCNFCFVEGYTVPIEDPETLQELEVCESCYGAIYGKLNGQPSEPKE